MDKRQISRSAYRIFTLKSLLWLIFGWTGFLLALTGCFHAWFVWVVFLACAGWLTVYFFKKENGFKLSKELAFVSVALVLFVAAVSFFTTPTVFSGRDQGSISQAAIHLAQNHKLVFKTPAGETFFKIYGAGRALNFPGFFYTGAGELITQFPLVYIAWLASFYGIFGVKGFVIANAVLSLWFLFGFYFLSRFFMSVRSSVLALFFAATSLSGYWFLKYTLSENMALPLVWLVIFAVVSFLKKQTKLDFFLLLASSILLVFTRIEGIAFFLTCAAVLFYKNETRTYLKNTMDRKLFLCLFFLLLLVFIANTFWDINLYREIAKALLSQSPSSQTTAPGEVGDPAIPDFYILKIFTLYGLLGFFILAAVALIAQIKMKDFIKSVPFFIIAPTLIYFLNSHISPDHPWMLRRFAFSILPGAIFYSALLLDDWQKQLTNQKNFLAKSAPTIVALFLLVGNLPTFGRFATFSENKQLLEQTEKFSRNFSANDLVLLDRLTTGDGWSMIGEPMNSLYGKNAVYFFRPDDFFKLDLRSFDNVYLVVPNDKIDYYKNSPLGNLLTATGQDAFSTVRLGLTKELDGTGVDFPQKKHVVSPVTIFKISKQPNQLL